MIQTSLFLGLPVTADLERALNAVNPTALALFTQGGEDYLELHSHQEQRFLGKAIADGTDIARLHLIEANVISLLNCLLPDRAFTASSLVLVPNSVTLEMQSPL